MQNSRAALRWPTSSRLVLLPFCLALAVGCSREQPAVADAPPAASVPAKVAATPALPKADGAAAMPERMDCTGAGSIRFALDFNAGEARAFEYAGGNPADRSIVCRYIASEGDETSTWNRGADGSTTVDIKESSNNGPARFVLVPSESGWRVQVVTSTPTGSCLSTPPPDMMLLSGQPGAECTLTAQGGIAASIKAQQERMGELCRTSRVDVAQAPSQTVDPAEVFRELPAEIISMSPEFRNATLAGSDRLQKLDATTGFLSVDRGASADSAAADATGYVMGTFRDRSGRTVVAIIANALDGVHQGIWRADERGWEPVGCDLIENYRSDHQYFPVAGGKSLEVYDAFGQVEGHLTWNGERFVDS